jgi:hypothetical protein
MDQLTIREIVDQILRGQIRIPAFQRGFVWEPDRVAYLMDSIYKRYPFGSLLFWRTREKLSVERDLGPFKLPSPKEDYPVDYVLDGQQRITSIFGVFQRELEMQNPGDWQDIFFDLRADQSVQETQFFALPEAEVDRSRHFPMNTLFDTVAYRQATEKFDDPTKVVIDEMQAVFKEVRIPLQVFRTEEKSTVAIIFERVNRQGVPLDTLQLLSAWTWSEEFQLQEQFGDLSEQLTPFGFADVGADTNLLLRCCAAILKNDASPEALMGLNGAQVRERFGEVINGVMGAVDYLRTHFNVHSLANLPFATILVPLSVFFAIEGTRERGYSDEQRRAINRWFWRASFSRRYSSGTLRYLKTDIDEMVKLREGSANDLGAFAVGMSPAFFTDNSFVLGNVNTKTFILMLAERRPLSFVSGAAVNLAEKLKAANRTEFHHLMPRAFLQKSGQGDGIESLLGNMAFMSRADNRALGGAAPSEYRARITGDVSAILEGAVCPPALFTDNYEAFLTERAEMLAKLAAGLIS